MAIRKDPHVGGDGKAKTGYPTASAGRSYINTLVENGRVPEGYLRAYPCKTCGEYHVGKRPLPVAHRRRGRGAW